MGLLLTSITNKFRTIRQIVLINMYIFFVFINAAPFLLGESLADKTRQQINTLITKGKSETNYNEANKYFQKALIVIEQDATINKYEKQFLLATTWQALGKITQQAYKKDRKKHILKTKFYRYQRKAIDILIQIKQSAGETANRLDRINGVQADAIGKFVPQSQYAIAWAYHDLAEMAPSKQDSQTYYQNAITAFKYFTEMDYENHPIIASAFLGHGICLYALGQYSTSLKLISPLKITNTPNDIYDKLILLKINNYKAVNKLENVISTLKIYFQTSVNNRPFNHFKTQLLLEWARTVIAIEKSKNIDLSNNIKFIEKHLNHITNKNRDAFYRIAGAREINSPGFKLNNIKISFENKLYEKTLTLIYDVLEKHNVDDHLLKEYKYRLTICQWYLKQYLKAYNSSIHFIEEYQNDARCNEISLILIESGYQSHINSGNPYEEKLNETYNHLLTLENSTIKASQIHIKMGWIALDKKHFFKAKSLLSEIPNTDVIFGEAIYGIFYCLSQSEYSISQINKYVSSLNTWYMMYPNKTEIYIKSCKVIIQILSNSTVTVKNKDIIQQLLTMLQKNNVLGEPLLQQMDELQIQIDLQSELCKKSLLSIQQYCHKFHTNDHSAIFIYNLIEPLNNRFYTTNNNCNNLYNETLIIIFKTLLDFISKNPSVELATQNSLLRINYYNHLFNNELYQSCIDVINRDLKNNNIAQNSIALKLLATAYENKSLWKDAQKIWHTIIHITPKHQTEWYQAHYHQIISMHKGGDKNKAQKLYNNFMIRYSHIKDQNWQLKFNNLKSLIIHKPKP